MKMKIDIDDLSAYCNVCALVDQEDFLKDVIQLRKKYSFNPNEYDSEWDRRLENETDPQNKLLGSKRINYLTNKYIQSSKTNKKISFEEHTKEMVKAYRQFNKIEDFYFDIEEIRSKFKRPHFFHLVIESAIVKGKITKDDYLPAYVTYSSMYNHNRYENCLFQKDFESEMIITIYPETTKEDVLQAWKEAQSYLKDDMKRKRINKMKKQHQCKLAQRWVK